MRKCINFNNSLNLQTTGLSKLPKERAGALVDLDMKKQLQEERKIILEKEQPPNQEKENKNDQNWIDVHYNNCLILNKFPTKSLPVPNKPPFYQW